MSPTPSITPKLTAAQITGAWTGDGKSPATAFRPKVFDDHPLAKGESYVVLNDAVGGVGSPTVQAHLGNTTLAAVQANPTYSGKVTVLGTVNADGSITPLVSV
jgi:hypothetical protein